MAQALEKDLFLFSGLKTHAQLYEASRLLTRTDGAIKPYNEFAGDFNALNQRYNQTYLQAEYHYAVSAAQSAANWADLQEDTDRYLLQYRTAGDERVRDSHATLNRITLPKDDKFWDRYYPPNGWRCRCLAIEVLARDHPKSDPAAAMAEGDKATTQIGKDGKNRLEIFRFNPGKQKVLFPPNHPYQPRHCNGEKLNLTGLIGAAPWLLSAESDKCKAKKVVQGMQKSAEAKKRQEYLNIMEPLLKKNVIRYVGSDKRIKINFSRKGNEHIVNDVLTKTTGLTKKDLPNLHTLVREAEYVRSSELYKERKDDIQRFYYFFDKEKVAYYHVAEAVEKRAKGRVNLNRFVYSISNEIPEK
jgi:SPP1 gp7 family putative phage head morphogenesis protein